MDDRRCSSRAADMEKRQPRAQISARAKILYGQLHSYNPPLVPKYSLTESDPKLGDQLGRGHLRRLHALNTGSDDTRHNLNRYAEAYLPNLTVH